MLRSTLTRRALLRGLVLVFPSTALAGETVYLRDPDGSAPPNLVRSVQQTLSECGFGPGPIDGLMGPMTRSAIRDFQTANDLAVTGAIDEPLLIALGLYDPGAFKDQPYPADQIADCVIPPHGGS